MIKISDLPVMTTNPCCEIPLDMNNQQLNEVFQKFFNPNYNSSMPAKPPPKPVQYENMGESVKIAERHPMFAFASLLDEILEDFGGVSEIMSCNWNNITNEGLAVCLMKDWRVFRYLLKANEFATLSQEDRVSKINRECLIFEDMDEWSHWEDLGGNQEEQDKKSLEKKQQEEKMTIYGEKMKDALDDFFNGDVGSLSKIMSKNQGNKGSYLDSEA